jgi:hypothetical protein
VYSLLFAVGGFFMFIGAVVLCFGIKTPEGKKVDLGLGTCYDRTGFCFRAIVVLFIGAMAFTVGLLING